MPIFLPPLRERREDILPLVNHILGQLSVKYNKVINTLSESAIALVMNYDWPGNVRELENVLERSFLFSTSPIIYELLLPHTNKDKLKNVGQQAHLTLKQAEALLIKQELTRFIGNVGDVAKSLGITPRAIHQKIKLHNIDLNHFRAQ